MKGNPVKTGFVSANVEDYQARKQIRALNDFGCHAIHKTVKEAKVHIRNLDAGDWFVVNSLHNLANNPEELFDVLKRVAEENANFKVLSTGWTLKGHSEIHKALKIMKQLHSFNHNNIRQRTLKGLKQARKDGLIGGRPPKLNAECIAFAKRNLRKGMTKTEVAHTLNVSRSTLNRALKQ